MDNDPKHTSGLVQNWLFNQGIQLIDAPPYSGDLNPMENLWADLNRRVESRFAHTIEELKQVIVEEWNNTSVLMLSKLVASMPKRCKAIVDNQGHKTKY
jgi:transposase